jgi:outer membrane protein assembly factor BamB
VLAALLLLLLTFPEGCSQKRPGPVLDVIFTANSEGSVLNLPCSRAGGGVDFHTIPALVEAVKALQQESRRDGISAITIDGGNSFFGVDDFSPSQGGMPVADLFQYGGYSAAVPGQLEFCLAGLFDAGRSPVPLVASNLIAAESKIPPGFPPVLPSFKWADGSMTVEIFSLFSPVESPLLPGVREEYPGFAFSLDEGAFIQQVKHSTAAIRIVVYHGGGVAGFAKRLGGAGVVIPARYQDCLEPGRASTIGGTLVLPYIDSRFMGAARIRLHGERGGMKADIAFKKPAGTAKLPPIFEKHDAEFRKAYGGDYEKIRTAIMGVGHPRLTHNLEKMAATPTARAVADAMRAFAGTDTAIINVMSVRKPLAGVIRGEYTEWLLPFGNRLVTMDLTGEQLKAAMRVNLKGGTSTLVMAGGRARPGSGGGSLEITLDGRPIEDRKVYRVATNDYLSGGEKPDYRIFQLGRRVRKTEIPLGAIFLSRMARAGWFDLPPGMEGGLSWDQVERIAGPAERAGEAARHGYLDIAARDALLLHRGGDPRGTALLEKLKAGQGFCTPCLGGEEEAEQYWKNVTADSPKAGDGSSWLVMKGLFLYRKGKVKEAAAAWRQAHTRSPGMPGLDRLVSLFGQKAESYPPIWAKFKGDASNSGRSSLAGPAGKGVKVLWKFKTHHSIKSSPAIAHDGTIYFGGGDGFFYALTSKGRELWRYQAGGFILSSPAIGEDGTIYFGGAPLGGAPRRMNFQGVKEDTPGGTGYVYALNPDGSLLWRHATGGWVASSPAITPGGEIVAGCNDARLYCIRPDGTLRWKLKTGGKILSSPAVAPDGTIYVGSEDQHLYAVAPDGTVKWRFKAGNKFFSSPCIAPGGTIYIGNDDSHLYALGPQGDLLMSKKFPAPITSTVSVGRQGELYVGCEDGVLYCLAPGGAGKWSFRGGDEFFSSPIIDKNGCIYIGCEDNFLYALSPEGTLMWKFETGDYVESTPVVGPGGVIYLGAEDKYFYALTDDKEGKAPARKEDSGDED